MVELNSGLRNENIKYINFLEWISNPQLVALTVTRLCRCTTPGFSWFWLFKDIYMTIRFVCNTLQNHNTNIPNSLPIVITTFVKLTLTMTRFQNRIPIYYVLIILYYVLSTFSVGAADRKSIKIYNLDIMTFNSSSNIDIYVHILLDR